MQNAYDQMQGISLINKRGRGAVSLHRCELKRLHTASRMSVAKRHSKMDIRRFLKGSDGRVFAQ